MSAVYIVAAKRTPIGSILGSLSTVPATELGAVAVKGAMEQSGLSPEDIQGIYFGNVISSNLGQAPITQVVLSAGLTEKIPATLVNKVCASGMKAVQVAASDIRLGDAHILIAGGMESMSLTPFYAPKQRAGHKFGNIELLDGLVRDGLMDVYDGSMMGTCGDMCAAEYNITREDQDNFAIRSYKLALEAQEKGFTAEEITPVVIKGRKGDITVDTDEEPGKVLFDKVPKLKPAFGKEGTVTAANASKLNDGACALILASEEAVKQHNLKPLARIASYADAARTPKWFTIAPADAMPMAIQKAGLKQDDIDLFDINEAFSSVAIANQKIMGFDPEKLNVHGGAVALGHPLGASGARIIRTLMSALKARNAKYGCLGICNGGGGASAMVIENLQ